MQVRKAAVRILWEACIRVPSFPKASEACVAVLQRVADSEESIQDLVGKVFHGLWFASKREGACLPLTSCVHSAMAALPIACLLLFLGVLLCQISCKAGAEVLFSLPPRDARGIGETLIVLNTSKREQIMYQQVHVLTWSCVCRVWCRHSVHASCEGTAARRCGASCL